MPSQTPLRHATEVAVVGGGPAGAALAVHLASEGREVTLFERWPAPRWRASGVYSSPVTRDALRALGLPEQRVAALLRPISALRVEMLDGTSCRLAHTAAGHAVGVDRVRLEAALLERARAAGASVREGAVVVEARPSRDGRAHTVLEVAGAGRRERWTASLVIGADGPHSLIARSLGGAVARPALRRAGLTVHRADATAPPDGTAMDARLVFGPGWYCGLTPVPGARVNVGIVLREADLRARLKATAGEAKPAERVVADILDGVPRVDGEREAWRHGPPSDAAQVALPLAHRPKRLAGPGWLLVGDAAGFIDPVTGEGLRRALASAELAAEAVAALRAGEADALASYDRALRERYARKDLISWLLQLFMNRPALLRYAIRRLDRRDAVRRTFGMVMSDLAPPERALDPRFIASLLAP